MNFTSDEVEVRRFASILIFGIVNFWAEKASFKKGKSVKLPEFEKWLREEQIKGAKNVPISDLALLNKNRILTDHYSGNNYTNSEHSCYVSFDINKQQELLNWARNIVNFLKKYP